MLALWLAVPTLAGAQTLGDRPEPPPPELPRVEPDPRIHVTPPSAPTRVGVGLFLRSLDHVDPPSQVFPHFSATLHLALRWQDPRLAFDAAADGLERHVYQGDDASEQLHAMWHPAIVFANEDGTRTVEGRTLVIHADGTVGYDELLSGRFHARVELRRFPFDTQRFHIAAQSATWSVGEVELEVLDGHTGLDTDDREGSLEWHLTALERRMHRVEEAGSRVPHARATFLAVAERAPGFYLWKLILPLLIIVCLTWSTFWMSGEAAPTRLQRAFIALLSIVAYHHVVANHLPRIPYLTFMDAMVYLAFLFTSATVVQIISTYRLERRGQPERALLVDRACRWAFPAVFMGTLTAAALFYGLHL